MIEMTKQVDEGLPKEFVAIWVWDNKANRYRISRMERLSATLEHLYREKFAEERRQQEMSGNE